MNKKIITLIAILCFSMESAGVVYLEPGSGNNKSALRPAAIGCSAGAEKISLPSENEPFNILLVWPPSRTHATRACSIHYLANALRDKHLLHLLANKLAEANPEDAFYRKLALAKEEDLPAFNVEVLDLSLTDKNFDFEGVLKSKRYHIVGFSTLTQLFKKTKEYISSVKKASPESALILGGWHASALPKEVMDETGSDIVAVGQAVETLAEIALRLYYTDNVKTAKERVAMAAPFVNGIYYRDENGQAVSTGERDMLLGFHYYPSPYKYDSSVLKEMYPDQTAPDIENPGADRLRVAFMHTSFGCPFHCKYCANRAVYKEYMVRSLESIRQELEELYEKGYRVISFRDEIFTLNRERTLKIVEILQEFKDRAKAEGSNFFWVCDTRADLLDKELITKMKRSGILDIAMGIESGDADLVHQVKGPRVDQQKIIKNIREVLSQNIGIAGYMQVGLPGQSLVSVLKSAVFLRKMQITAPSIFITMPFPGSEYYSPQNTGPIRMISDITDNKVSNTKTETESMTWREIRLAYKCLHGIADFNKKLYLGNEGKNAIAKLMASLGIKGAILGDDMLILGTLRVASIVDLVVNSHPSANTKKRDEILNELIRGGRDLYSIYNTCLDSDSNVPCYKDNPFNFFIQPKFGDEIDEMLGAIHFKNGFDVLKNMSMEGMYYLLIIIYSFWGKDKRPADIYFKDIDSKTFEDSILTLCEKATADVGTDDKQKIGSPIRVDYKDGILTIMPADKEDAKKQAAAAGDGKAVEVRLSQVEPKVLMSIAAAA